MSLQVPIYDPASRALTLTDIDTLGGGGTLDGSGTGVLTGEAWRVARERVNGAGLDLSETLSVNDDTQVVTVAGELDVTGDIHVGALVISGSVTLAPDAEVTGFPTDAGPQGEKGDKGDTGDAGAQGIQGVQGIKGDAGNQGIQGVKGDKGDAGNQGIQGVQGIQGIQGAAGPSNFGVDLGFDRIIVYKNGAITVRSGYSPAVWTDANFPSEIMPTFLISVAANDILRYRFWCPVAGTYNLSVDYARNTNTSSFQGSANGGASYTGTLVDTVGAAAGSGLGVAAGVQLVLAQGWNDWYAKVITARGYLILSRLILTGV